MKLSDAAAALEAQLVIGEEALDREVTSAGGCDIVSDLLFYGKPGMLLLTGLTQPAIVRAALLLDMSAVVFVRGKRPDEEATELARSAGLPLLVSPHSLYDCSGRLYAKGLPGIIPAGKDTPTRPA